MALSINTNAGAMIGLQSLNKINTMLGTTQLRITTGLRINGPKDDAATFAIAQNMRGAIAGAAAVTTNLALGKSIVSVAINAGVAIANLLSEIKAKSVQASQEGLGADSYAALNDDFISLRDQIDSVIASAEFGGKNLIKSGASNHVVLSTMDGSTITVSAQQIQPVNMGFGAIDVATATNASAALIVIDAAIITVSNSLAAFGSAAKRIDIQMNFTDQLRDILKHGVANLVETDLAEETANLQAHKIRQQLGVQALAIANAGPQSFLQLFA